MGKTGAMVGYRAKRNINIESTTHLLWGMDTNQVLLHCNAEFLEGLLAFFLDLLCPLQFLLPSLIKAFHKFLARLHLFLKFSLGDSLNTAIFGLVRDLLLLRRNTGVESIF